MAEEEISTKEKIIQTTFSLLKDDVFSRLSLSRIAKEVGISKTAIYRHFESKDALDAAIRDRVFSDTTELTKQLDKIYKEGRYEDCIRLALRYLYEKPEYLSYVLFSTPNLGEDFQFQKLSESGVTFLSEVFDKNHHVINEHFYIHGFFVFVTMIDFMLAFSSVCDFKNKNGIKDVSYEDWENHVIKMIKKGLRIKNPTISDERLSHLNTLCKKSLENIPQVDKKLVALSNVIYREGLPNVTVEAVANELGIVKSSLYSHFSDKDDMVLSLVTTELNQMLGLVAQNTEECDEMSEKIYVLLRTEIDYFMTRREMLTVCKWIQISGLYSSHINENFIHTTYNDKVRQLSENIAKNQTFFDRKLVSGWVFSFPVFLVVNALCHNFSKDELDITLNKLYLLIAGGFNETHS